MKNRILVLVVVCSLLACSLNLAAKERRGAELVVTKTDGQQIRGELIAVKQDSLLLLSREGADVSVGMYEISAIKKIRKSKALVLGGVGFAVGAFFSLAQGTEFLESDLSFLACFVLAAFVGAIVAAPMVAIGVLLGTDTTYQIEGKSPEETNKILEKLRRQARVPDAQ